MTHVFLRGSTALMNEKVKQDTAAVAPDVLAAFAELVGIVDRLRRECPWDREQTHASVKHLLIEEAYETVDAIDAADPAELKKELGDLLLHVLFHSEIAKGNGTFALAEVIRTESEKLVRRHPHVYANLAVDGTAEVLANWEQIKMKEGQGGQSALDGVPRQLPALLRAQRIQEKVAGVGFDFPARQEAWAKVDEELAELHALPPDADADAREDEFGDVLFALVNYARFLGITPENALQRTNAKFIRRFQYIETALAAQGQTPADATLEEMDALWNAAKAEE